MAFIENFELIRIPVEFYKTMGQDIFETAKHNRLKSISLKILLYGGLGNYIIEYMLQVVFFVLALRSNEYLVAYAVAPSIGFGLVAYFKMMTLHMNRSSIRDILREFELIYPKTMELQRDYQIEKFYRLLKPIMKLYAGLCLMNTFYYLFFPLVKSVSACLLFGVKFDFPLPLFIWYPYDPKGNWTLYLLTYGMQLYGSLLTAVGYLTADLFLVSSVEQLCIHFNYVSLRFEQFEPSSDENNHRYLARIVKHHIKCLEISDSVDRIFGFSLFLNFFASSGTLCFVGFQVTSATIEELLQNIVLLVTSLSQVFIICFYGNKLMYTSQAVGEAAFGHAWYMCNMEYRRMVALVITRSQKMAAIHAPTFPPISLETFMKVISMAYQFFAVIRTTSDN
uniref:Odorant receptor n=1 Tax=Scaeva pyrastri TaxID=219539 RepID=A0A1B3B7A0_SCAPY|nr:putative odorant receptor OR12 [Scaeva pyrastri]